MRSFRKNVIKKNRACFLVPDYANNIKSGRSALNLIDQSSTLSRLKFDPSSKFSKLSMIFPLKRRARRVGSKIKTRLMKRSKDRNLINPTCLRAAFKADCIQRQVSEDEIRRGLRFPAAVTFFLPSWQVDSAAASLVIKVALAAITLHNWNDITHREALRAVQLPTQDVAKLWNRKQFICTSSLIIILTFVSMSLQMYIFPKNKPKKTYDAFFRGIAISLVLSQPWWYWLVKIG